MKKFLLAAVLIFASAGVQASEVTLGQILDAYRGDNKLMVGYIVGATSAHITVLQSKGCYCGPRLTAHALGDRVVGRLEAIKEIQDSVNYEVAIMHAVSAEFECKT